jgi:hypothetical protein
MSTGAHSEEPNIPAQAPTRAKLFDLRSVLGGLFLAYGVIVLVMGLIASEEDKTKAAGTNVNLWAGIVMFVLGALFLLWRRMSPTRIAPDAGDEQEEQS